MVQRALLFKIITALKPSPGILPEFFEDLKNKTVRGDGKIRHTGV
jgi:hypothetical protein